MLKKENDFISIDRKRGFELTTPIEKRSYIDIFATLFPPQKSIALTQIFNEINEITGFLNCFTQFDFKRRSKKPESIYFYASLISRTQRKGLKQLGDRFGELDQNKFKRTLVNYFTVENLQKANKAVRNFVNELEIASVSETGNNQYYFTDKQGLFSRSTVLCCSAIEFPYALDMILGNPSVPPEEEDIFIKKPMDCTEVLFGIAKLLGFSYSMSIQDFGKYKIYGFDNTESQYEYINPDSWINENLISGNWDEMLRFAYTIHSGYTPASIIIPKFINRFDDPVFLGFRELGRIQQTIFILKYIENLQLRQTIENHFAKSGFHQKLSGLIQKPRKRLEFIGYEDRQLNGGCKNLINNCIMAWNYLYLSNKMRERSADIEELTQTIKYGFIPVWNHIDMTK